LALEAINKVKKAESESEELLKEATEKSKEIINNAKNEAENTYNKILNDANSKRNEIIRKAEDEGNAKAEPILVKGREEISQIKNIPKEKKNNAINLIVERIVKIHGNS
jgi:V/A-type H+/Na+-transporting ATPase subunit G/H